MAEKRRNWTRKELLVVFRMYCRTPFGRLHLNNPEMARVANLIGRTPSAVIMKACNFASFDPQHRNRNVTALKHTARADRELWEEFIGDSEAVASEAEEAFLSFCGTGPNVPMTLEESLKASGENEFHRIETISGETLLPPGGSSEIPRLINVRRIQSFFRTAVLVSYEFRCALTGLDIQELLNASHIIPWSSEEKRRADPRNGICLNAFHDRAFDRGFISFDEKMRVIVSPSVEMDKPCSFLREQLINLEGRSLQMPTRFLPDAQAIEYHRTRIFKHH